MAKRKYVLWRRDDSDLDVAKGKRARRQCGIFDTKARAEKRRDQLVKERKLDAGEFEIKTVR